MQNMENDQKPDMAAVRRQRHQLARRGQQVPGMPRNNPLLVAFLAIFVFLPLMLYGGVFLAALITGNYSTWNVLVGLTLRLFTK